MLFYRWFLLQNILEHKLLDEYEFFVITRSDHFYVLPHPSLNTLTDKKISIPKGEEHDGVTNRHVVLPKKFVVSYLDILNKMVTHGLDYMSKMCIHNRWNLEKFIKFHLEEHQIYPYVQFFSRKTLNPFYKCFLENPLIKSM